MFVFNKNIDYWITPDKHHLPIQRTDIIIVLPLKKSLMMKKVIMA